MKYLKQVAFLLFMVAAISINVSIIYGSSVSTSCTINCALVTCSYDEQGQLSHVECQYVDGANDTCHNCSLTEVGEN